MHLRQPEFTYGACEPFTKHCERIKKFRETGDSKHIYKNDLHKACFANDAANSDTKDLATRITQTTFWKIRAFENARNLKCDGY